VLGQVGAQQFLVQRPAGGVGAGVGVRVHQARQQPALRHQLGTGDRVVGPPVAVGVQIDELAAGQRAAPDPQHAHPAPPARRPSTRVANAGRSVIGTTDAS
jgi:hypothetical protein